MGLSSAFTALHLHGMRVLPPAINKDAIRGKHALDVRGDGKRQRKHRGPAMSDALPHLHNQAVTILLSQVVAFLLAG